MKTKAVSVWLGASKGLKTHMQQQDIRKRPCGADLAICFHLGALGVALQKHLCHGILLADTDVYNLPKA